jgi:ribosomal protein S6
MEFYQFNLLLSPNMSEADTVSFVEKTETEMQKYGRLVSDKKADRRKLAYPINKEIEAWLYFFNLYLEAENKKEILDSIEKSLKEDKNVLRFLIIRKAERVQKPIRRRVEKASSETAPKAEEKKEETHSEEKPKKPKAQLEEIGKKLDEMLGE